jgi:dienelactone hydrolase
LNDWARDTADQIAAMGYIVVVPDLLSGLGPNGGGRAWWFATQRKDLSVALVFYDAAPPVDALAGVTAPVYGFYAARTRSLSRLQEILKCM